MERIDKQTIMPQNDLQPTLIFIFVGIGDLTYRKLIPSLYNLYIDNYMPAQFQIICIGRTDFTNTSYRAHVKKGVQEFSRRKTDMKDTWTKFAQHIEYNAMDLESDKTYKALGGKIKKWEAEWQTRVTSIFYMSVAPQLAPVIAKRLHAAKLCADADHSRMVFEKPFGHDLQSATALNDLLCEMFEEKQIYRIDHY